LSDLRKQGFSGFSPLLRLPYFDVIADRVDDIMHLLSENVMKEVCNAIRGRNGCKVLRSTESLFVKLMNEARLNAVDQRIKAIIHPSNMEALPPISVATWTAHQYQVLSLGLLLPLIYDYVSPLWQHFIRCLCCAHRICVCLSVDRALNSIMEKLFDEVYRVWSFLQPKVKLSMHRPVHLADKQRLQGPQSHVWVYGFERYFGGAAEMTGTNAQMGQIVNNLRDRMLLASWASVR
jgi:hypothetical protein